jgi:hypothetical protein
VGPAQIKDFCPVDDTARRLLSTAMRQMQLSRRAYHRILKRARTIADSQSDGTSLAGEERTPAPASQVPTSGRCTLPRRFNTSRGGRQWTRSSSENSDELSGATSP